MVAISLALKFVFVGKITFVVRYLIFIFQICKKAVSCFLLFLVLSCEINADKICFVAWFLNRVFGLELANAFTGLPIWQYVLVLTEQMSSLYDFLISHMDFTFSFAFSRSETTKLVVAIFVCVG